MGVFKWHGQYYIDFYVRGRRRREKVGPSKGEAIQALSVRQAEVAQGKFKLLPKRGSPRFEAVSEKYLNLISIHKRGHSVEGHIVKTLNAFFGKSRVCNLIAQDAERYKAMRSRLVKPATINRELTLVKHMLTKGVEWKLIAENPFRGVRNLNVPKHIERVLGQDEEVKLLAACDRVRSRLLRPLVVLALNTGMRRGELLSLEWSRVDLDQRIIRVINAKSNAGDRVIPMNAAVHSLVHDLAKKATSPLVFPSNRKPGARLLDLKKGFKKAVRLAGIRNLRFHDTRHTFATRLVHAGVDLVTVSYLLGHSKITMTARYAHALADVKIAAVNKLDSAGVCSVPDSNRTPAPNLVESETDLNAFSATA
jgi:integrase